MRLASRFFFLFFAGLLAITAHAQISRFEHIVLIIQENRTPDNLFQALCGPTRSLCPNPYNLKNVGVNSKGQKITLTPIPLGNGYDLAHRHSAFVDMCNYDATTQKCKMDGADKINCRPHGVDCPPNAQFKFVQASDIGPYLTLAQQYGWANFMFQTNQGSSTASHLFLFAGTSARTAADDAAATFVTSVGEGCLAPLNKMYLLISPQTAPDEFKVVNNPKGTMCLSHDTMASLLDLYLPPGPPLRWKYYTGSVDSIWTAPNWFREICVPNSNYKSCTGQEWNNVVTPPQQVLTDIVTCNLARVVSWVTPPRYYTDHPAGGITNTGGPSWVASIVNAIGNSTTCDNNTGYWNNTAIVITWDDWGGWFDHVSPTILSPPDQGYGDYQYGFRVPLLFVSAYTPVGYVNNGRHDFGSILRFIQYNFGIPQGALNFADQRATTNLKGFYNLSQVPRVFVPISAPKNAEDILNDKRSVELPYAVERDASGHPFP